MEERLPIPPGMEGCVWKAGPGRPRQPHRHLELEMNLVLAGRADYLMGSLRVPLVAGSMIWLFPRQEHLLIDSSAGFAMWVIVFRQSLVAACAECPTRHVLRSPDPGEVFCRQVHPEPAEALDRIFRSAQEEAADSHFINATLHYALLEAWRAYSFSENAIPSLHVHPAVARAARLVAHASEPVSLNAIARQAGLSAGRLSRLFHQQVGVSLTGFRQQTQLKRFLRLYGTGNRHSIMEAALNAGFGSYPQFHRVFSRSMKCSPQAYKRRLGSESQKVTLGPVQSSGAGPALRQRPSTEFR